MKKLAIMLFEQVEVLDFAGPFEVFSVANQLHDYRLFEVFTVSAQNTCLKTVNGLKVTPDYSFANCPENIDYLVVPGGDGSREAHADVVYQHWLSARLKTAERVLSICSGARFLASLGFLTNKAFCTHQGVYDAILRIDPEAIPHANLRYVHYGKLISAGGISAGIDASFALLEKIGSAHIAKETAKYMEYHRQSANVSSHWC